MRVLEKWGGPNALGLAHGPKFERPGEVVRLETREAVGENARVEIPGLGK